MDTEDKLIIGFFSKANALNQFGPKPEGGDEGNVLVSTGSSWSGINTLASGIPDGRNL